MRPGTAPSSGFRVVAFLKITFGQLTSLAVAISCSVRNMKLGQAIDLFRQSFRRCHSLFRTEHGSGPTVLPVFAAPSESLFEISSLGSTGDPPVPSGDPPDGTGVTVRATKSALFKRRASAVPVGGSPTGAGESPALPIFKTRSGWLPNPEYLPPTSHF